MLHFNKLWNDWKCNFVLVIEVLSSFDIKSLIRNEIHETCVLITILVHLSRRLKCTIVRRPSVRRLSSLTFHIFDFFSETAQQNSMKLDRKQDPNVLYIVCVFEPIGKTKMAALPLICWDIFRLLLWNHWTEFKEARKQDLNVLNQVCVFRADQKNKMAALASDWLRHFRLLLWNHWTEFNKT